MSSVFGSYNLDAFMLLFSGTIMTISKDRVKPSQFPDSWKLSEIFATGIVLGSYLAMMTVLFFYAAYKTQFFTVNAPSLFHSKHTLGVYQNKSPLFCE